MTEKNAARRCHCRPGCLAPLRPSDQVEPTANGPALVAHLVPQMTPYPLDGVQFGTVSPLSRRWAR